MGTERIELFSVVDPKAPDGLPLQKCSRLNMIATWRGIRVLLITRDQIIVSMVFGATSARAPAAIRGIWRIWDTGGIQRVD